MSVTLDAVMSALREVRGYVRDLKIEGDTVSLVLSKASVEGQVREALARAGAKRVEIRADAGVDKHGVPGVKHIIAVSSGKGGVGKSTVAANLAVALARGGAAVGLLDADVYGPNIPTMMGINRPPEARMDEKRGELILPLEAHGVRVMSMGFLVKGDQPLVWRGPMLHGTVSQFLMKVDWGNLDYLVVDMPPGTGDVQLSLTQLVAVSGAVVVTTPQEVALQDVRRALLMFEKVGVPVLGIVENMAYFTCDSCEKKHEIFGSGGGARLADKFRTRLIAQLPLAAAVREAGDAGAPIVARVPSSAQAKAFAGLAEAVKDEVARASADTAKVTIGGF